MAKDKVTCYQLANSQLYRNVSVPVLLLCMCVLCFFSPFYMGYHQLLDHKLENTTLVMPKYKFFFFFFLIYRNWNDEKLTEETVEEKEKTNCILHFCSLSSCSQIRGWDVVLVCHQRPALAGRNC